MGLLSFLTKSVEAPPETKTATVRTLGDSFLGWLGYGPTSSGVVVDNETALCVPAVFRAVSVVAQGVAGMPIVLKERNLTGNGRWETRVVKNHWARRLLAVRPNGWQTPVEFVEGMLACAVLTGTALAVKNVVGKEVRELLPVPPGSWSVEQMSDYSLRYRIDYSDKTHGYFTQSQVLVLNGPSLNSFAAMPAIHLARDAIGLSAALQHQQSQLAGKGGNPSGILSAAGEVKPETREKLAETWKKKFGLGGPGGVAVLDGLWKFEPLAMTSVDAQVLESRRFQIEEIARAFGVQPILLMQADKAATYASAEQMMLAHVIHTLMPWVTRFEQVLVRDVLCNDDALFFDFDETLLLRGNPRDQGDFFQKALGSGGVPGFLSVNEVRDQMGYPRVEEDWADQIPRGSQSENLQSAPSPDQETPPAPQAPVEEEDA